MLLDIANLVKLVEGDPLLVNDDFASKGCNMGEQFITAASINLLALVSLL